MDLGSFSKYRTEGLLIIVTLILWLPVLFASFTITSSLETQGTADQAFWFSLENPDGGRLSYPVLALSYFEFLHHLSGNDFILFCNIAALVSLLAFLAIFPIFHSMGVPWGKLLILSFLFYPMLLLIMFRMDIIAVALALFSVLLFFKNRKTEGWLLLATGAFFKVFPVFFAPLFLAVELRNFNRHTVARLLFLALLGILALFFFEDNIQAVVFHSERGIQVESIYANLLYLVNFVFPLDIHSEYNYGSRHIVLPESLNFLPALAMMVQFATVLVVSWLFYSDGAKKERLFLYAFLIAASMILTIKVLSTQFILWPLVFAVPLLDRVGGWKFPAAFFALSWITFLVFPVLWEELNAMEPFAVALLTMRNVILAGVFAWFLRNRKNPSLEYRAQKV